MFASVLKVLVVFVNLMISDLLVDEPRNALVSPIIQIELCDSVINNNEQRG